MCVAPRRPERRGTAQRCDSTSSGAEPSPPPPPSAARRAWRGPRHRACAEPVRAPPALRRRATPAARETGAAPAPSSSPAPACTRSCESRVRCGAEFADRRQRPRLDGEAESAGEANRAQRAQPILAHALLGVADRAHEAPLEVLASAERIAQLAASSGEYAIALIVKSRRARSSSRIAPNSTSACRPSVCTSRRNVVTSCMHPRRRRARSPCRTRCPPGSCAGDRRVARTSSGVARSRDPSRGARGRAARRGWHHRRTRPRSRRPRGWRRSPARCRCG